MGKKEDKTSERRDEIVAESGVESLMFLDPEEFDAAAIGIYENPLDASDVRVVYDYDLLLKVHSDIVRSIEELKDLTDEEVYCMASDGVADTVRSIAYKETEGSRPPIVVRMA